MYPPLNLPPAELRMDGEQVWDGLRKKWLKCTPEEWVRQHFIHYLISHLNYPKGRMVSEYLVKYNQMNKRCDIALFSAERKAEVIVECKAPKIALTEDTFYQVAKYAHVLGAPLLILTNGLAHYCALIDQTSGSIKYLPEIPNYENLKKLIG